MRVRRRGRVVSHRSRQRALWRRACERAAAFGGAGQHGRLLHAAEARRHRPGDEPGPWRPPDPRTSAEFLRQALHDRPLRCAKRRRADRLRGAREACARAQAKDDHGRRQRLSTHHRFRTHRESRPRHRRSGRHRHGPHRGPRCRKNPPEPRSAFRLRHDDDAQDIARSARRSRAVPGAVREGSRSHRVSRHPGRTADACHRRQGGVPEGSPRSELRRLPEADRRQRQATGEPSFVCRVPPGERRHRQPPDARRRVLQRTHRKGRGSRVGQSGHYRQQERDTLRSESADGGERHPYRHSCRHEPWHARSRHGHRRRTHRARTGDAGRRHRSWSRENRSRRAVPEIPAISGSVSARPKRSGLQATVAEAFAPDGAIARALPGFEAREGQLQMAAAAADVFAEGGVLLAEAGTGTGKTLAYLVPAILSGNRVLISTGTKNLQEQIFFKDLPVLRESLGVKFTATYMKGRGNYLCLHHFEAQRDSPAFRTKDETHYLNLIDDWRKTTDTGDRAEIEDLPEDIGFWNEVAATAENCIGAECPQHNECYVTRMRQRAAESDLVIVNHHLLCADAAVRQGTYGEVIPDCEHAIVDEAHQLEDVATQYFGISVSNYRVEELARDTERAVSRGQVPDADRADELRDDVDRIRDRAREFFDALQMVR